MHLPQKQENSHYGSDCGITEYDPKMGQYLTEIAGYDRPFQLNSMQKRQDICDLAEGTAYQLQVKPNPGKPGGKVGKKGAADAAHLLYA